MTEPTYRIDQIEAAMKRAGTSVGERDMILAELTRPAHQFRDGEVYWVGAVGSYDIWRDDGREKRSNLEMDRRPLRLSEMPAAVAELRVFVDWVAAQNNLLARQRAPYEDILREAPLCLAAFDKAIAAEES